MTGAASRWAAVAAVAAALTVAGCGSGDGGPDLGSEPLAASPAPTESPATSTSSSSTSPTTSRTTSKKPLSPFEDDPAIKVLRRHYLGVALAVNQKNMNIPELTETSTPTWFKELGGYLRPEFGGYYPGPVPLTPVEVYRETATRTVVLFCVMEGWFINPDTGKPVNKRSIDVVRGVLVKRQGKWIVDDLPYRKKLNAMCEGVHVAEVKF